MAKGPEDLSNKVFGELGDLEVNKKAAIDALDRLKLQKPIYPKDAYETLLQRAQQRIDDIDEQIALAKAAGSTAKKPRKPKKR